MKSLAAQATLQDSLNSLLAEGSNQAKRNGLPVLVSLTYQAPGSRPLAAFASRGLAGNFRILWGRPDADFWLVGAGKAAELNAAGTGCIENLKQAQASLLANAVIQTSGLPGVGPLFLGGFRYDTAAPRDNLWRNFPDAALILPRFLSTFSKGRVWLTINHLVNPGDDIKVASELLMKEAPSQEIGTDSGYCQPWSEVCDLTSYPEWIKRVEAALGAIQDGSLSKVVLSRRKLLKARSQFSLDRALERLTDLYPECAVFAVDTGRTSFAGATPEILARVEMGKLNLSCLASSAPRGKSQLEDETLERELLSSPKERREHAEVLTMLTQTLKDVCINQRFPETPRVWKLKNVQHLLTPFSAELRPGCGILDIIRKLHPTPAVGGSPTDKALELIRSQEGDRGWYASPIGWLDRNGNGEFGVAIRSALIDREKAYLYAGAGIVQGSDPEQEYAETEIKFQPMFSALTENNQ